MLGAFTDEATVACAREAHGQEGLPRRRSEMAHTFDLLRANDLVFQYVVNNWLMGENPPAFDLLAWNDDSTRMPAKMHSRYLRSCYLRNEFAGGELVVDGVTLDPGAVEQSTPTCVAPSTITSCRGSPPTRPRSSSAGDNRFVLADGGPHRRHRQSLPARRRSTGPRTPSRASRSEWFEQAELKQATWWQDWATWMTRRSGRKVAAPSGFGGGVYEVLDDAPVSS